MRLPFLAPLAAFTTLSVAVSAHATAYTFTTLNAPGQAVSINDSGQVLLVRPFYYADLTDSTSLVPPASFLFDTRTSALTIISYPGSDDTEVAKINNLGVISGTEYAPVTSDPAGFLLDTKTGSFTGLLPLGRVATVNILGLNDAGVVVGSTYFTSHSQGFLYDPSTAKLTTLSFNPTDINDAGIVVGGPIYDTTTQTSTVLKYPDSSYTATYALAINNTGEVIGQALRPTSDILYPYAFLSVVYDLSSKTYTALNDPNGTNTIAKGINDAGEIVGTYTDTSGTIRSFLATPDPSTTVPEPASLALLGTTVLGLGLIRHRRSQPG